MIPDAAKISDTLTRALQPWDETKGTAPLQPTSELQVLGLKYALGQHVTDA